MGFGVVSLSLGNPPFPLGNGLVRNVKGLGQIPLGQAGLPAQLPDQQTDFCDIHRITSGEQYKGTAGEKQPTDRRVLAVKIL